VNVAGGEATEPRPSIPGEQAVRAWFSRRESVEIDNTVLECMMRALKRGREVELPFGKLKRVRRFIGDS
jgi:hypothetical protein